MDANKVDMTMDRRKFLGGAAALGALAMGSGMMAGCAPASSASGAGSGVQTTETLSETGEASWYCAEDFEGGYDWTDGDIAYEAEPIDESAIGETVECDLVVCGAGIAGLAAAASAIEQGLSVIVLEKGTTYAAHGSEIGAIGGRVLAEAGLAPDPVDVYNEAMEAAEYRCDGTVWQNLYRPFRRSHRLARGRNPEGLVRSLLAFFCGRPYRQRSELARHDGSVGSRLRCCCRGHNELRD